MTDRASGEVYEGLRNLEAMTGAIRYNRFLVESVVRAGQGAKTVLDFGAGIGGLASELGKHGLAVVCVEPDPSLRERLIARGLHVEAGLEGVRDRSFELACAINVLEHIEADAATLSDLRAKLRPGGRVFLYVPAFQSLFSSMDRRVGHRRRYDRSRLRDVARRAGLTVESMEYADSLGFFAALAYKHLGDDGGELSPAAVRAYDRLFPFSRCLDRLGLRHLFGKNLMTVLRRIET